MIERLEATDFVRFERLQADLVSGLTVVSGDSGAGKTVFLQALRFALGVEAGGRAVALQRIRSGAEETRVTAWLRLGKRQREAVAELLGETPPSLLALRRTLRRGGRGQCHVGDRRVPRTLLQQLGRRLVSFLGQGEAAELRDEEHQRRVLDTHAGITEQVEAYATRRAAALEAQAELAAVTERLEATTTLDPARMAELEALRELEPAPQEYEELEARAGVLDRRLEEVLAIARLSERVEALDLLGGCAELERGLTSSTGPRLAAASDALATASALLGEAIAGIEAEAHEREARAEETRAELAAVTERLDAYRTVARRLRVRPETLPRRWEELAAGSPEELEARQRELGATVRRARRALDLAASKLSKARARSAKALEQALPESLEHLGLVGATVAIDLIPVEAPACSLAGHPSPWGRERVVIRVGPNGETPGPLSFLSGGELARVYLVLGRYASGQDRTLVCDEIDQNVGARLGAAVGQALASLAQERQVLAVTHLAPVAARADLHLKVEKHRGRSRVAPLTGRSERLQELALMINGQPTRAALAQARELLRGGIVSAA